MGYIFTQYSNKSGVDVSVVQSTGTSRVDVMSQDATTRELNSVKQAINKSASALLELQNGIITPVGSFQTDSSVAYVKDVPENALPRAELKKVGGITKKTGSSTNLLPYPYPSNATTIAGVTFTDRGDGSIKVNGTAEDYVIYVLATEGSVNFGNSNMSAGISFGAGDGYVLSGGTDHITLQYFSETRECLLTIAEGVTVDDEVVYPMVNTGLFPETWEPYKAPTLYTAKVTEVESVEVNLFDKSKVTVTETETGFSFTNTGANSSPMYIGLLKDIAPNLRAGDTVTFYADIINASRLGDFLYLAGSARDWHEGVFLTITDGDLNANVFAYGASNVVCEYTNVIFTKTANAPYTPYVSHTLPIPVEVRGSENLIPEKSVVIGKYWEINANGTVFQENLAGYMCASEPLLVKPNNTYYVSSKQDGTIIAWAVWFVDENYKALGRTEGWQGTGGTFTVPSHCRYALFTARYNKESYQNNIMINEGTTALPYEPYGITGLDGYGLGVSDTVYNYIDWEKKQSVKRCASVDLGTLGWEKQGTWLHAPLLAFRAYSPNGLCSLYSPVVGTDLLVDKTFCKDPNGRIYLMDSAYTDVATFKAAMQGVMLVYELATPEVTDISQYITDDDVNIMKVGAGGTITFKNGYAEAVPSEIEYQVGA